MVAKAKHIQNGDIKDYYLNISEDTMNVRTRLSKSSRKGLNFYFLKVL